MFDPVTLVVAFGIAHIAGTIALLAVWAVNRGVPGILRWIAGRLMIGISLAMLPLQVGLPRTPVVVIAGTMTIAGLIMAVTGTRQFMARKPLPTWLVWGFPAAYALLLVWLLEWQPEFLKLSSATSTAIAFVSFLHVVSLWPDKTDVVRVSSRLMAGIFGLNGLFHLVRAAYGAVLPAPESPTDPSLDVTLALLSGITISVLTATTYTAMVTEYLQSDLRRQAEMDPLTGLLNRRSFDARAMDAIRHARRFGGGLALLYLDLDHFKAINDRYGHSAGDQVLRRLAEIATASLRDRDLSARLGGEEFAILLPRVDAHAARMVAERIRQGMEACRFDIDEESYRATVSIGLTVLDSADDDLEQLSRRADLALYRAKQEGRNRTVVGAGCEV